MGRSIIVRTLRQAVFTALPWAFVPFAALAQSHVSYFGSAQVANNLSSAAIPAFDGSDQCGTFTTGSKWSLPNFRIGAMLPKSGDWSFGAALGFENLSTNFEIVPSATSNTPNVLAPNGSYVPANRLRDYNASLNLLTASFLAGIEVLPRLNLSAGPFLGLILQHSYSETERLTTSGLLYAENGLNSRSIASGSIPVNTFQAGLDLAVSYDVAFQPNLLLRPGFSAMLPVTQVTSQSWRIFPAGFSLGLVYRATDAAPLAPIVSIPEPVPPPQPIAPIAKKHVLDISIQAFGVNDDGSEVAEPTLSIERLHVTEVYPMLHYVFFDDGSAQIPSRYRQRNANDRDSFQESNLFTSGALEIHHNILDILGKRLREAPNASVTLLGTRSLHSDGDVKRGKTIANDRAASIAIYFETVWGISPDRLHIRSRDLPELASDDQNPFGEAENRRVEIVPSDDAIAAPLRTERIERVASPPHINFDSKILTSEGIREGTIVIEQRDRIVQTFDALSGGPIGAIAWTIDPKTMPDNHDSLTYTLSVVDSIGDTARASGSIHLRKEIHDRSVHVSDTSIDKEMHRYSLILFDYSSSQLDRKESESIIGDMANNIEGESQVTLTGHTDKTGDDQFNEKLARDRVTRAAELLRSALRKSGDASPSMLVESHGSRDNLFDNSIPEGRVLSRTVRALIETEVGQ